MENPFYQLDLPLTATPREATEALQRAKIHASVPLATMESSYQLIVDQPSGSRLAAELSYLCDSPPNVIMAAYAFLTEQAPAEDLVSFGSTLSPVSAANFLVHVATRFTIDGHALCSIIDAQASVNIETLFNTLKAARNKARLPPPPLVSIHQALEWLFDLHADTIVANYASAENAAPPLCHCAQHILCDGNAHQLRAVGRILNAYRRASAARRSDQEARIIATCDALSSPDTAPGDLDDLISLLRSWILISRPLVVYDLSQPARRDDTTVVNRKLSSLISHFAERNEHDRALKLAAFAASELDPIFTARTIPFANDVQLISRAMSDITLNRLRAFIDDVKTNPAALLADLNEAGFESQSSGTAKQAWDLFLEASVRHASVEPWGMMSDLAVRLGNSNDTDKLAAGALLMGLIQHAEQTSASAEVLETLTSDFHRFRSLYAQGQIETQADHIPSQQQPPIKAGRRRAIAAAGVSAAMLGLLGIAYTINSKLPRLWPHQHPPALAVSADFPEEIPPTGTGQHLDLKSVRYCHYQEARLKFIKPNVQGPAALEAFNALAIDYNARCSDFFYKDSDLVIVDAEIDARRAQLEADAHRIVATWNERQGITNKPFAESTPQP